MLPLAEAVSGAAQIEGEVVRVDRFGNLITNVERQLVEAFLSAERPHVHVAGASVPLVGTYADVPDGHLCALFGSTNHLEIAANRGSAAARLGLGPGARVVISPARD
jgi:S-adenosylmethionine hydrolase